MKKILLFTATAMVAASASAAMVVDKEFNLAGLSGLPGWASDETVPKLTLTEEGLVVNNPEETANFWDLQFIIGGGLTLVEGVDYTVTAEIKTKATGNIHLAFGDWGSKPVESDFVVENGSDDWQTLSYVAKASASMNDAFGLMQSGKFVGEYIVKSVTVSHEGNTSEDPAAKWVSIITNGNANNGVSDNILSRISGEDIAAPIVDNPFGEGKVFECPIVAGGEGIDPWTSQMFIQFNEPVNAGTNVKVSFDYACSDSRTVDAQAHGKAGQYNSWNLFPGINAKPEWQSFYREFTVTDEQAGVDGFQSVAINLATAESAGTFYLNNVVVEKQEANETPDDPVTPGDENVIASFFDGTGATFGGWGGTIEQVEEDGKPCLKYTNEEAKNFWETQIAIDLPYVIGETYYFSFDVKGTGSEEISSGFQYAGLNNAGEQVYWGCGNCTGFKATPDWTNIVIEGTALAAEEGQAPGRWVANLGQYIGDLYLTNVKVYTIGTTTDVETITPVKVNTAVYNLQGVKVANSLDEVAAPGLYISNGKKVIKK